MVSKTPTTPPTGVNPTGGGTYNSSAGPAVPASGTGALSGPFYQETQTGLIRYKRLGIKGADNSVPTDFSLSAQTQSFLIEETKLGVRYLASLKTEKIVDDWYATSSFYQPQKFTLYTETVDNRGNVYDDPVGFQLGVGGHITTSQEYIRRELWDDNNPKHAALQAEFPGDTGYLVSSMGAQGSNIAGMIFPEGAMQGMVAGESYPLWYGFWMDYPPKMENAWDSSMNRHSYLPAETTPGPIYAHTDAWAFNYGVIPGPYQTNVEASTIDNLQNFVDGVFQDQAITVISNTVGNWPYANAWSSYMFRIGSLGSGAAGVDHPPNEQEPDAWVDFHPIAVRLYRTQRHDWT